MPYCEIRPGRIRLEDESTGSVRYIVQKDDNLEYLDANENRIQRLSNIVFGNEADLPSAGIKGRIYVATDTKKVFFDDGTSWTEIAGAAAGPQIPRVSAYVSTSTTVTAGSTIKIPFDAEEFDLQNEFDPSSYDFTAANTGYYEFNVKITLQPSDTVAYGNFYMYVNGTLDNAASYALTASTKHVTYCLTRIVNLTSGDVVNFKINAAGNDVYIIATDKKSVLTVKYLGT